ncbi:Uncharacterised protein [Mycobacteroides abscessus subsp. abscessus]|nr:Uncharacterised protein [Mycobacteroides abscessus subsp. abscessus]SIN20730.1 Uncharacterised protein [Mycobacteroides abscessus subsp. abscessus]SKT35302.1 Uncharacterised protein [Mycobacteroides abscessus subsp. abscessus]
MPASRLEAKMEMPMMPCWPSRATIGRAVTSATATTSRGMEAVNSER